MSADDIPAPAPITRPVRQIDLAAFPPKSDLISELLAALKNVRDNAQDDSPEMWAMVDAAIAKAEATRCVHPSVLRSLRESRDLLKDLEHSQEWSAEMREQISDAIHNADNALAALTP